MSFATVLQRDSNFALPLCVMALIMVFSLLIKLPKQPSKNTKDAAAVAAVSALAVNMKKKQDPNSSSLPFYALVSSALCLMLIIAGSVMSITTTNSTMNVKKLSAICINLGKTMESFCFFFYVLLQWRVLFLFQSVVLATSSLPSSSSAGNNRINSFNSYGGDRKTTFLTMTNLKVLKAIIITLFTIGITSTLVNDSFYIYKGFTRNVMLAFLDLYVNLPLLLTSTWLDIFQFSLYVMMGYRVQQSSGYRVANMGWYKSLLSVYACISCMGIYSAYSQYILAGRGLRYFLYANMQISESALLAFGIVGLVYVVNGLQSAAKLIKREDDAFTPVFNGAVNSHAVAASSSSISFEAASSYQHSLLQKNHTVRKTSSVHLPQMQQQQPQYNYDIQGGESSNVNRHYSLYEAQAREDTYPHYQTQKSSSPNPQYHSSVQSHTAPLYSHQGQEFSQVPQYPQQYAQELKTSSPPISFQPKPSYQQYDLDSLADNSDNSKNNVQVLRSSNAHYY